MGKPPIKPGRPPKPTADKSIRLNITLPPEVLALLDANVAPGERSGEIADLIRERWG